MWAGKSCLESLERQAMICDLFPSVYRWEEPVARKRHVCVECDAPIVRGEKHFKCFGVWEGDAQTHRQHLLCMEACMMIRDEFEDGECIGFGELMEWFGEMRREYDRDDERWQRLRSLMARIFWRERGGTL
jgi:hypothetical protein